MIYIYIYIYIHLHIYIGLLKGLDDERGGLRLRSALTISSFGCFCMLIVCLLLLVCCMCCSHDINLQNFNLRVLNPRTIAYAHFNMSIDSSNLPGAGPIFSRLSF